MPPGDDGELPALDPAALARAEAALAALGDTYLAWSEADAARLAAALDMARINPAAHLPEVFRLAHDMKGQAATFGYPLATDIANRLCRLIERTSAPGADEMNAIALHVGALVEAVGLHLKGDGGEAGRRLLDRLGG